jgi:hypothetical protein
MAVTLNLLITLLIVSRLIYMRAKARKHLGREHYSPYLSVSAMLTESAFIYSAFDLVFIVTYAINSPANFIVFPVVGQVEVRLQCCGLRFLLMVPTVCCPAAHYLARSTRQSIYEGDRDEYDRQRLDV